MNNERPKICDDQHLEYLDVLRETGVTNMFGAASWLAEEFEMSMEDAMPILKYWMKAFGEADR